MNTLSANEAKTHFGELLIQAQRSPVQIKKNGKPVVAVMSNEEFESLETLKLEMLKMRVKQAKEQANADSLTDGESFFDDLEAGQHD